MKKTKKKTLKPVATSVRLDRDVHDYLVESREALGLNMTFIINKAVREYMKDKPGG